MKQIVTESVGSVPYGVLQMQNLVFTQSGPFFISYMSSEFPAHMDQWISVLYIHYLLTAVHYLLAKCFKVAFILIFLHSVLPTAALIHQCVLVKRKDIRKFLDGVYVSDKGTIDPIEA